MRGRYWFRDKRLTPEELEEIYKAQIKRLKFYRRYMTGVTLSIPYFIFLLVSLLLSGFCIGLCIGFMDFSCLIE